MSNKTKICPKCRTEIDAKATICPNCKSKLASGSCGTYLILVIIVIIIMGWLGSNTEPTTQSLGVPDLAEICTYSQMKIDKGLKAPSTAKHPSCSKGSLTKNGNTYIFSSYVDAQNSFGAMIRNNYTCNLEFKGEGYSIECNILN